LPRQAPRPWPVHGQQRQPDRYHPVAEHRQKPEQSPDHEQDADSLAQPVIRVGLETVIVAENKLLQVLVPGFVELPLL